MAVVPSETESSLNRNLPSLFYSDFLRNRFSAFHFSPSTFFSNLTSPFRSSRRRECLPLPLPSNYLDSSMNYSNASRVHAVLEDVLERVLTNMHRIQKNLQFWQSIAQKSDNRKAYFMVFERGPRAFVGETVKLLRGRAAQDSSLQNICQSASDYVNERVNVLSFLRRSLAIFLAQIYVEVDKVGEELITDPEHKLPSLLVTINELFSTLEASIGHLHAMRQSDSSVDGTYSIPLLFEKLPEINQEGSQWTDCEIRDAISSVYQNLDKLESYICSLVVKHRKPKNITQHWVHYACGAVGLSVCSLWLLRHSSLMGSSDLDNWIQEAKDSTVSFFKDHVEQPILSIRDELFETFRKRHQGIMDLEEVRLTSNSLHRMLLAFSEQTKGQKSPVNASDQEMLEIVMDRYEKELMHPIQNLLNGELARAMLIQVQKLKLDIETAMLELNQILRANEINFAVLAAMRLDCTPICIKNMPLHDDDPAKGLTLMMTKLKLELCFSRGSQHYTFESKRDLLDLVYQGIDLYMPKGFLIKEEYGNVAKSINVMPKNSQSASEEKTFSEKGYFTHKNNDDGFLFSCDYFTIRKQSPKADPDRLLAWHEAGRRNLEKTNVQSNCEKESETDEHMEPDPSGDDGYNVVIEDDGYNVVIADSCQRVFVYGLKLLWTIENRNAICFWVGGLSKAFAPAKPSPSRQYAQRKLYENNKKQDGTETSQDEACETHQDDETETHRDDGAETHKDEGVETHQDEVSKFLPTGNISDSPSSLAASTSEIPSFPSHSLKLDSLPSAKYESTDDSKEGTRHFMVNVIEPQFNLHSEGANGRFLLAAVSGRVLAQSFHSVLRVGHDMIEQALGTTDENTSQYQPEIAWKRMEISVMLEHVQAHVAPTDVDLGAGVQWLPKIIRGSPKVMRTGALLERVFMPCDMYFQFTRHKGGTPEVKVKPLKELKFNSHNIIATMTSRQFQVMLDVLNNLLFARLPKPPKSSLTLSVEDDENVEEEADEVVPDGVEEVELAKINLEKKEREQNLLLDDMKKLFFWCDTSNRKEPEKERDLWMIYGGIAMLVQGLKRELVSAQKSRKEAYSELRTAMQKAAQVRLMEKEKNKSPSYAMRVFLQINKVVWSMILDGKSFAEAEINDMIYDFDRDYKDVGISQFTTKYIVFKNCLPNAKSDTIVSAWKPPDEWGNKVMLQVDARQGAPKDGSSPFELFQVEIYPLKIHLTETMYRMMWVYFFPEEERDSQRRQEVWKVSTTGGARRVKKGSSAHEASTSSNQSTKESEASSKSGISALLFPATNQPSGSAQTSKAQNVKVVPGAGSTPECEVTVAESVADENGPFGSIEKKDEVSKNKSKDVKGVKAGQSSLEEKKVAKPQDDKRSRPKKIMEFHNIKISQVELCITYEGQRFVVNDMKLLMDQFVRAEFTGTWQRLFSRVKKHIIWGVLKSVTGMQGKKFKDKVQNQPSGAGAPEGEANFSDTEGHAGKPDKFPPSWPKRPTDGAGDGFVTSVRGIFNSQRRKAKKLLKPKKDEAENEGHGDLSENEVETTHFARQLTIIKAKKLFKRDPKKPPHSKGQKGSSSIQNEELPSSPKEAIAYDSDSSSGSSSYELILE